MSTRVTHQAQAAAAGALRLEMSTANTAPHAVAHDVAHDVAQAAPTEAHWRARAWLNVHVAER